MALFAALPFRHGVRHYTRKSGMPGAAIVGSQAMIW